MRKPLLLFKDRYMLNGNRIKPISLTTLPDLTFTTKPNNCEWIYYNEIFNLPNLFSAA